MRQIKPAGEPRGFLFCGMIRATKGCGNMSCKARLMRMGFSEEQAARILQRYAEAGTMHELTEYLVAKDTQSISDRLSSILADTASPARSD